MIGKKTPKIEDSDFDPKFKNALYFVYLNQKKNSHQAVKEFMEKDINDGEINRANELSMLISVSKSLSEFELLLGEHERFIGQLLSIEPIKEKCFKKELKSPDNLKIWEDMIVKDTESPENLKNWKEMIGKDMGKSGEFEILTKNDCKR